MKLILHHFLKDIRAQRWLLLFALIAIVLQIVIDLLETQADYHLASVAEFVRSTRVLPLMGSVLWILLLARLILSEPVTGATSFWLTRPVPRSVYIPSKLLFILLFLVIPYLIPTPLDMLRYGVDSAHVVAKMQSSLLIDLYLILILLWLATYTRTMTQFWGSLIAVALTVIAALTAAMYFRFFLGQFALPGRVQLIFTRWTLFVIILFSGLLLSLLIQHTRRKASGGFIFGVVSVVVAVLAGVSFPFAMPLNVMEKLIPGTSFPPQKTTKVEFSDGWRQSLTWMRNTTTSEWVALGTFSPADPNALRAPVIQGMTVTFLSGHGMPEKLSNGITGSFPPETQFDIVKAIGADLPGIQIQDPTVGQGADSLSMFVLDAFTEKLLSGKTGTLTLSLYGNIHALIREAQIPLGIDALARSPSEIIHVTRLARNPDTFITDEKQEKPVLAVWNLSYAQDVRFQPPTCYYLLVDPQRQTGTLLHTTQSFRLGDGYSNFSAKTSKHVYLPLRGDEAIERMVLYIYEFKSGDFFDTTLTEPNFSMNPK